MTRTKSISLKLPARLMITKKLLFWGRGILCLFPLLLFVGSVLPHSHIPLWDNRTFWEFFEAEPDSVFWSSPVCCSGHNTPKMLRKNSVQRQLSRPPVRAEPGTSAAPQRSHSLLQRVLSKSRRKSCPHIPQSNMDTSSDNVGFQPD